MSKRQNCANRAKTVHLTTIHYGENIHHFFYIFGYFAIFYKDMKNKIDILKNNKYIFPIVNSFNLLSVHFLHEVYIFFPTTGLARKISGIQSAVD